MRSVRAGIAVGTVVAAGNVPQQPGVPAQGSIPQTPSASSQQQAPVGYNNQQQQAAAYQQQQQQYQQYYYQQQQAAAAAYQQQQQPQQGAPAPPGTQLPRGMVPPPPGYGVPPPPGYGVPPPPGYGVPPPPGYGVPPPPGYGGVPPSSGTPPVPPMLGQQPQQPPVVQPPMQPPMQPWQQGYGAQQVPYGAYGGGYNAAGAYDGQQQQAATQKVKPHGKYHTYGGKYDKNHKGKYEYDYEASGDGANGGIHAKPAGVTHTHHQVNGDTSGSGTAAPGAALSDSEFQEFNKDFKKDINKFAAYDAQFMVEAPFEAETLKQKWFWDAATLPLGNQLLVNPSVPDRFGMWWQRELVKTRKLEMMVEVDISGRLSKEQGFGFWYVNDPFYQKVHKEKSPAPHNYGDVLGADVALFGYRQNYDGFGVIFRANEKSGNVDVYCVENDGTFGVRPGLAHEGDEFSNSLLWRKDNGETHPVDKKTGEALPWKTQKPKFSFSNAKGKKEISISLKLSPKKMVVGMWVPDADTEQAVCSMSGIDFDGSFGMTSYTGAYARVAEPMLGQTAAAESSESSVIGDGETVDGGDIRRAAIGLHSITMRNLDPLSMPVDQSVVDMMAKNNELLSHKDGADAHEATQEDQATALNRLSDAVAHYINNVTEGQKNLSEGLQTFSDSLQNLQDTALITKDEFRYILGSTSPGEAVKRMKDQLTHAGSLLDKHQRDHSRRVDGLSRHVEITARGVANAEEMWQRAAETGDKLRAHHAEIEAAVRSGQTFYALGGFCVFAMCGMVLLLRRLMRLEQGMMSGLDMGSSFGGSIEMNTFGGRTSSAAPQHSNLDAMMGMPSSSAPVTMMGNMNMPRGGYFQTAPTTTMMGGPTPSFGGFTGRDASKEL